jgi:hypothetical protein
VALKKPVKSSNALESAALSDLRDGHTRLGQKLLRQKQPPRLREFDRADAKFQLHGPAQMPRADAEFASEGLEPSTIAKRAFIDPPRRQLRQTLHGIDRRVTRR